jgi:hypothetical protein
MWKKLREKKERKYKNLKNVILKIKIIIKIKVVKKAPFHNIFLKKISLVPSSLRFYPYGDISSTKQGK